MKKLLFLFLLVVLSACSTFKVAEIDPKTGYFPSETKADIIKHDKYDLDPMKSLVLVTAGAFVEGQVKNMKYFDEIINLGELQSIIVREGLQDKVPSIADKIGVNKAYTNYKPFLWFRYNVRKSEREAYVQFILTDPKDMKDIFIAEKRFDPVWGNDQSTWYPLCNAFIDYVRENSKIYRMP